jgi:hypothetical protein
MALTAAMVWQPVLYLALTGQLQPTLQEAPAAEAAADLAAEAAADLAAYRFQGALHPVNV